LETRVLLACRFVPPVLERETRKEPREEAIMGTCTWKALMTLAENPVTRMLAYRWHVADGKPLTDLTRDELVTHGIARACRGALTATPRFAWNALVQFNRWAAGEQELAWGDLDAIGRALLVLWGQNRIAIINTWQFTEAQLDVQLATGTPCAALATEILRQRGGPLPSAGNGNRNRRNDAVPATRHDNAPAEAYAQAARDRLAARQRIEREFRDRFNAGTINAAELDVFLASVQATPTFALLKFADRLDNPDTAAQAGTRRMRRQWHPAI
jgi:hypothetical protein